MTLDTQRAAAEIAHVQTDAILELAGVTIRYARAQSPLVIVDDYNLTIAAGQMHCLAGRSGSGKTSILRVAAGLVKPTGGEVRWLGEPLAGLSDDAITRRRRKNVGYLDQGGMLVQGLTALENVLLPAVPERRSRAMSRRAMDLLARLGVAERASYYPEKLSGGERQRVALARALMLEPAMIMADEPTASLDRASADSVIGLLTALSDDGIAVLVAAHDQHLIDAADSHTRLL